MDSNEKIDLSIVTPVYGCKSCLTELYFRLKENIEVISSNYEIIMVNDGSPDDSWGTIIELANKDKRVKGLNLSRNFGQHLAITAGLKYCSGSRVVVMDCDLQDRPEEIQRLYAKALEGYDVVFARRVYRQDSFIKRTTSKLFYNVFDYFTDNKSDHSVSNFGIFSKQIILNYLEFKEQIRLFPLLVKWMGFKITYIDVEHARRKTGRSSYNLGKLFNLAIDVIISQSNKPLKLSIKVGFLMSLLAIVYLIFLVFRKLYFDIPLGWTSIMVAILFIGGLTFANLGLIGLYLGKIYDELKGRPLFIIKDLTENFNEKTNGEILK